MVIGLAGFALAGAAGGAAPSGAALVACRALQGAFAACTVPAALAILTHRFEGEPGRRALGWWTAAGAGGGAAGFVLGGVVSGGLGWRATFFTLAALAALSLAAAVALVPREAGRREGGTATPRLDLAGSALATGGLLLLLLGLSHAESGGIDATSALAMAGGVALLAGFAITERRVTDPLLAPGTFRNRALAVGVSASFVLTATTSPAAVLGTTYLEVVRGWSATTTGLAFVPFSLAVVAGAAIGQRMLGARDARATLIATLVVSGLGLGCAAVAATATGTGALPGSQQGLASGLVNTGTQLGTAIGVAVLIPIAGSELGGLRAGYFVAAGLALAAALALTRVRT